MQDHPHKSGDHSLHMHAKSDNNVQNQSGHDKHKGHHIDDFRRRFIIASLVTIPVLLLSHMIQQWLGFNLSFPGDKIVLAIFSTFIFIYGGKPFLLGMYDEIKYKAIGMMTLIGIAISVAWGYSLAVSFGLKGMDFYWEMATLIDIMLIGHYFEMKSVANASRSLELLVKLLPSIAHLKQTDNIVDVALSELKPGDLILVKPGEKIPVDGIVQSGESYLNESMLTGESKPVQKKIQDTVIGGSINGNGSLNIQVSKVGSESYLSQVIKLVEQAQKTKSKTQNFADKAAKVLTLVAIGGGFLTFAVWMFLGYSFAFSLERMVTVMVISCPHALGLAVPLVVSISTSLSAQNGLLIRNRIAFENSRFISTVIFDKTGTLTKGSHKLTKIDIQQSDYTINETIRLAASIEQFSEHFIASAIIEYAKENNIIYPEGNSFEYLPGFGTQGIVDNKQIKVVGPNYFKLHKNKKYKETIEAKTVVYLLVDDDIVALFSMEDEIREESFQAIQILRHHGIKNLLLTGDNEHVAQRVSSELKMDGYLANVLPHEKLNKVVELQKKGEFVAMTGDGVNDAPALAQADVGIAIGSGTDVAAETADIVLVNSNPNDIVKLILFGKATYSKMIQNLWWAAGYNILAIPLAAGVLYNWGIMLSPAVGAVLMSMSTIVVAVNAQLLKSKLKKWN